MIAMKQETNNHTDIALQGFVNEIKSIINTVRSNAVRSVDSCRVKMYWAIGKRIVEKEQQGKERAAYGTYLIKNLAKEIELGSCINTFPIGRFCTRVCKISHGRI